MTQYNAPHHAASHDTTLQHTATRCKSLQSEEIVGEYRNKCARAHDTVQHTTPCCNSLQHTATWRNCWQLFKKKILPYSWNKKQISLEIFWLKIDVYDYIDICCLYLRFHGDLFVINRFLMISRFDLAALALPHVPRYLKLRPETNLSASRAKT